MSGKEVKNEKNSIPVTGQIVYAKKSSLFFKTIELREGSFTALFKKTTRPYVVVSNTTANKALDTVQVCPIRTVPNGSNLEGKIFYVDKKAVREIEATQVFTVDKKDLSWNTLFFFTT